MDCPELDDDFAELLLDFVEEDDFFEEFDFADELDFVGTLHRLAFLRLSRSPA